MSEKPEDAAEIRRHCYHEAGHAVCMLLRGVGVEKIVISEEMSFVDPVRGTGDVFGKLIAALAGGVAQERLTGQPPAPEHVAGDIPAINMYLEWLEGGGFDRAKARADAESEAQFLVEKYWAAIERLVERLLALPPVCGRREMRGSDFDQLVRPEILRIKREASKSSDAGTAGV